MSAPPRGGRGYGGGSGGRGGRGGGGGYGQYEYNYDGYGYGDGWDQSGDYPGYGANGGGPRKSGYGPPSDYRRESDGSGSDYHGNPPAGNKGRGGLGYIKPEKTPEEECPPPPIVDGYAEEGMNAMPSTGIDYKKNQYQCYVCNSWTNTEVIMNAHLQGKTHIKKLEQAGYNSFLPPKPLGPIPATQALKEEKWKTGEKRKYSEIDPTNKGFFSCEVCNLEFNSRIVYETHMQGKKHARMLKSIEEMKAHEDDGNSCHYCNFIATSAVHMQAHLNGKNHKKRVDAAEKGLPGGTPMSVPKTDPDAPKMLAPMHAKKAKTEDSSGAGGYGQGYGEDYYEESGEYYEEGGESNAGGAAGYYGY